MKSKLRFISSEEILNNSNILTLTENFKEAYISYKEMIEVPQRISILRDNPFTAFDIMPAYSEKEGLFITKVGAVVPKEGVDQISVNTTLVAFSSVTGEMIAIFDGDEITKLKCAAISALVTDYCAVKDATTLGIIGSGVQAQQQIRGITAVRTIEKIKIYSRNKERIKQFIQKNQAVYPNIEFIACESVKELAEDAQIISTATTSVDPVISAEQLNLKHLHINCIGNHITESREIPNEVLEDSFLIVEDRETAILEAGVIHKKASTIEEIVKSEPFDLQMKRTIFSSTGHAFLDLIAVSHVIKNLGLQIQNN